ncbi:MAG: 16S rRNA (cytosine(1402)-N(4))-methyltransferase RsmH [Opitutales bacterium]|nr:16S rRNA (cytosine(1402)-N(4))-methyltransferase RsmH [Opitutales bacterium]
MMEQGALREEKQGHIPVMLEEVLAYAKEVKPLKILDCCFGGGGHTRAFLEQTDATVVAIDRDPDAVERSQALVKEFGDRFRLVSCNYSEIDEIGESGFDIIFYDLGISSFHVDVAERGFSFRKDAPLDMRMDTREGMSAAEFLEKAPNDGLVKAVREYGEEKNWKSIVKAIEEARGTGILSRTVSLANLLESVTPAKVRRLNKGIHPATKTFQGIRMAINEELMHLEASLPKAFELLNVGGRLLVISFHSLEDRIVKRQFRRWAGYPENRFDSTPRQDREILAELLVRKPLRPTEAEVQRNPRSRSSLMRVLEKTAGGEQ